MASQNEARAAGNDQIGPGHLVLGLLSEPEALAAAAIVAQGVGLDAVREAVIPTLPPAAEQVPGLLALLELEDGSGVLSGLGIDKETAEANISAWLESRVKGDAGQR